MPIYMDRHDVSDTVTAGHVAELHQQDLTVQDQFNCRGLTYWFDEKRKMAFCLVEAPNRQAIQTMHDQAHGVVPHHIIEVDPTIVESFLGRIEDPQKAHQDGLNIIDDPAFRVIMRTGLDNCTLEEEKIATKNLNLPACMQSLAGAFDHFDGRVVQQNRNYFLVSFTSVSQALLCAIEIQSNFAEWSDEVNCHEINLKTGISAGVPVTENKSFFEDAIQTAEQLFYISNGKIVVSSEIKKIYHEENLEIQIDPELFIVLHNADEKFLNHLLNYIGETWQNPNLQVEDIGRNMGYSKSQVYRKMISLTGKSPNNFIKDYRLNKSLGLIKNLTGNLAEVAYEAGFNSASYFAKCFSKKYGLLPSEYLQEIAG